MVFGTGCPHHPENLPPASLWDGAHHPYPPKGQRTDRAQILSNNPPWAHRLLAEEDYTQHLVAGYAQGLLPTAHAYRRGAFPTFPSAQLGGRAKRELTPHSPSPGQDTRGTAVGMEL